MEVTACIPVYNNEKTIAQTIMSVVMQGCVDEIILGDDCSTDNSQIACQNIKSMFGNISEIKYYRNQVNLGCGRNLQKLSEMASNELILYMCGDDVIADPHYIYKAKIIMESDKQVKIMSRDYYWFTEKWDSPVRYKARVKTIAGMFDLYDQISGIVVRKSTFDDKSVRFSNKPWVEMVSVAANIYRKGGSQFHLPEYSIAVRIGDNTSATGKVFRESPTQLWYNEVKGIKELEKYPARKHEGLVQVKRFGGWKAWAREVFVMAKIDHVNLIRPRFWFYVLLTTLPKKALAKIVDVYRSLPKKMLKDIVDSIAERRELTTEG